MVTINSKNVITMTRGDTLRAHIKIYQKEGSGLVEYIPQQGDTVVFAVKSIAMNSTRTAYLNRDPLVVVNIPIDTMTLEVLPAQTKNLAFGDYDYDIELTMADGTVDTFINGARLTLRPEVY